MESFIGLLWIGSVIAGTMIGAKKGEGIISFFMCCLLGPLWLLVVVLSKGNKADCPYCGEPINKKAVVCPHCRSSVAGV